MIDISIELNEQDKFHPMNPANPFGNIAAQTAPSGFTMPSRRRFLTGMVATSASMLAAPAIVRANVSNRIGPDRVWITSIYTGESISHPFRMSSSSADKAAWASYSYFWRDAKDGNAAVWIDRRMLETLARIQMALSMAAGHEVRFTMTSGHRTRRRNATIRGAAHNSFHIYGKAVDFGARSFSHRDVQYVASRSPGVGGVGFYPNFTHVDSGPSGRRWHG